MKKPLVLLCSLMLMLSATAQTSGLHIPSEKPLKPKELLQAWNNPELFCLLLHFDDGDSAYREIDLDLLDSAYNIAFDKNSPRLYTMSIEAYGHGSDSALMKMRVESVYRYFTMRGHEVMPVRYAYNPIHCSCYGDTVELIRFEVPTDKQVYDCAELPGSRKVFNKDVHLEGTVLVTFRHNPIECIGSNSGCFLPAQDSNIRAYYTQLLLKKGSIYAVYNTRGECPPPVELSIDEHLDYKQFFEHYFLVPHQRQIILPIGYIVLHSSFTRKPGECQYLMDSIFVRFPVTEEQVESGLKVFAKKMGTKGVEYRQINTKKIKGGPVLLLQGAINASQFDTIFLAKRIAVEEVSKYLYPADSPSEQGAVTIMVDGEERYFKPFRINGKGEYDYRKPFRSLLRIVEGEEENVEEDSSDAFRNDGDEEIE
ncbi:MAG: hypothetical protein MJZ77_02680 [Bacteroidales bacterium]|nr:hypothetical protein [Bacteroidales bacterium]